MKDYWGGDNNNLREEGESLLLEIHPATNSRKIERKQILRG